jgi:hypothetical protein
MICQCKSGFFSLRDCGETALGQCSVCQRGMCRQHAAVETQFTQCRDCFARNAQADDRMKRGAYDDDWAYNYRHRYYSSGYAPVYTGTHYHRYYDHYDTRSLHSRSRDYDDDSDNARAGFGDS